MIKRINIGCGDTPTNGWLNYDNSPSINIANSPIKYFFLKKFKLLNSAQLQNIEWNKKNKILYADATKNLPFNNNEVKYIYSSHMLEHLSKESANKFLKECLRILSPRGILRIVVPDLRKLVDSYIKNGDADFFLEESYLVPPAIETLRDKLKIILIGYRHHQWMYDSKSLSKLLSEIGFQSVMEKIPGNTSMRNYGELNLFERSDSSIFIEAIK